MEGFLGNFLANLAADALLAIAIYLILTQPSERRRSRHRRQRALGLLKSEAQINRERALSYLEALANEPNGLPADKFPLGFTRGAWNALRESGFIGEIEDPELAYYLFRMNEIAVTANKNLRRLELAHLEDTGGRIRELHSLLHRNISGYLGAVEHALDRLERVIPISVDRVVLEFRGNTEDHG